MFVWLYWASNSWARCLVWHKVQHPNTILCGKGKKVDLGFLLKLSFDDNSWAWTYSLAFLCYSFLLCPLEKVEETRIPIFLLIIPLSMGLLILLMMQHMWCLLLRRKCTRFVLYKERDNVERERERDRLLTLL
jgi:hypothetical protein